MKCPLGCAHCSSLIFCTSCISGFVLSNNLCLNSCPVRHILKNGVCQSCPYDCLECDNTGNCISCSNSSDFRALNLFTFRCTPLPGYFDAGVTVSVQCPGGCASCLNMTICSSCTADYYFRADRLCYTTCLARFFPNSSSQFCELCPFDCFICDQAGACLSCDAANDHRSLNTNTSRCNPLEGYF